MTNLQKLHKKASNLISDILDFEGFNQGDIVEFKQIVFNFPSIEYEIIKIDKYNSCLLCRDSVYQNTYSSKDLKLKQRNITLPMVLEAIKKKEVNWNIIPSDANNIDFVKIIPDGWEYLAEWQLRKDNRDCSLFDQKNETVKFIIKVLK